MLCQTLECWEQSAMKKGEKIRKLVATMMSTEQEAEERGARNKQWEVVSNGHEQRAGSRKQPGAGNKEWIVGINSDVMSTEHKAEREMEQGTSSVTRTKVLWQI